MIWIIHNRKILFVIIILIIILGGIIFLIKNNSEKIINFNNECVVDLDCFQSSCCHATSCVSIDKKPDCKESVCSMDCESVLDCENGKCGCVNNKCIVIKNK